MYISRRYTSGLLCLAEYVNIYHKLYNVGQEMRTSDIHRLTSIRGDLVSYVYCYLCLFSHNAYCSFATTNHRLSSIFCLRSNICRLMCTLTSVAVMEIDLHTRTVFKPFVFLYLFVNKLNCFNSLINNAYA